MNAGFIKKIKAAIEETKAELNQKRAGQEDSQLSPEEEDKLLDHLGMLIELLQQFEE